MSDAIPVEGPAWARPYESARQRATLVTIFLLASVLALVVGIAFDIVDIAYLRTAAPGDSFTLVEAALGITYLLAFYATLIPAVIFFCVWLHSVVRNMPALGARDPRWSPAGAVVRSFIPFLNLVHPLWSTLEAWRGADPETRWIDARARKAIRAPLLISAWWALWLIGAVTSQVASRMSSSADTGTQVTGLALDIVSNLALIGAAVLAVLVVREVTARQDHKNELIAGAQLA